MKGHRTIKRLSSLVARHGVRRGKIDTKAQREERGYRKHRANTNAAHEQHGG